MSFFRKLFGGKADNTEEIQGQIQEPDEAVVAEKSPGEVAELSDLEKVFSKFQGTVSEDEITTRLGLLEEHASNLFTRAAQFTDVIPQDYLNICRTIFENSKYDVLENFIDCELNGRAGHFGYRNDEDRVFFVASPMPWTKEEAVEHLTNTSDEPPYGYIKLFTNLINNRPSPDLTNFMQLLICSGGGMFEMHVCFAQMRTGNPHDGYEFTLYPTDLLNDEEKKLAGL